MSNTFKGVGNLGGDPTLKSPVGDEQRKVADLRIYFDRPVKIPESGEFEEKGGFWLDVSVWDKLAEHVVRLLKKGARVKVEGSLKRNTWQDKDSGESKEKYVLYADEITLVMSRIQSINYQQKATEE